MSHPPASTRPRHPAARKSSGMAALVHLVANPTERLSYRRFAVTILVIVLAFVLVWNHLMEAKDWMQGMLWIAGLFLGADTSQKVLSPRTRVEVEADGSSAAEVIGTPARGGIAGGEEPGQPGGGGS